MSRRRWVHVSTSAGVALIVAATVGTAHDRVVKPGEATTAAVAASSPTALKRPMIERVVARVANPSAIGDRRLVAGKRIEVSIAHQTLTAWSDGNRILTFLISTGKPGYATPKGNFKVKGKYRKAWSRKWKVWMPYTLNFYQNYNLHELPYAPGSTRRVGADRLGKRDSHGCIRVGLGNAKKLYEWAEIGTPVWVH